MAIKTLNKLSSQGVQNVTLIVIELEHKIICSISLIGNKSRSHARLLIYFLFIKCKNNLLRKEKEDKVLSKVQWNKIEFKREQESGKISAIKR